MKTLVIATALLGAGAAFAASPASAMGRAGGVSDTTYAPIIHVAHAGAPYSNVDRRNDAGNDTGDSQVDRLNDQALQRARGQ